MSAIASQISPWTRIAGSIRSCCCVLPSALLSIVGAQASAGGHDGEG
jgi:hypothetical protein